MKLTAILLLAACLQVSARSESQTVTLNVKNTTLKKVFKAIQKQTGLDIFLDEALLKKKSKVTLDVINMPVPEVLAICFRNDPFTFSIIDERIVVKRKTVVVKSVEKPLNESPPPIVLTGRVVNEKNEPLQGVTILLKNSKNAVNTDEKGYFKINVPDNNGVLVFSSVGYNTQQISVDNKKIINVTMVLEFSDLNAVVVTALGIQRSAKSLVYASQNIKASELTGVRDANNVVNSLQGKVANAVITQGSGGVGSGARIVLRGNRSLQASNNALIVVDGVPIMNSTTSAATSDYGSIQGSDGASMINPDDIESVQVLPGASAAALYGSEAGNGVIIITTKKGTTDKISVNVNSGITVDRPFALPDFQNNYGQGQGNVFIATEGASWGPKFNGQDYTNYLGETRKYSAEKDNVSKFFRTGISLNNSIAVSGGNKNMQTYLSYTNNSIQGILPKNDLMRHTINLRISNQVSKRFSTDAKVTYINQDIQHRPQTGETNTSVFDAYQTPRNVSNADMANNYQIISSVGVPDRAPWPNTLTFYQNPYWMINNTNISEMRDRIMGFLSAKYQINNWLSITGRANMDKLIDNSKRAFSQGTVEYVSQPGGYYTEFNNRSTQQWFDVIVSGSNKIGENFNLNYNVGAIYKDRLSAGVQSIANGLSIPNKFSLNYGITNSTDAGGYEVKEQGVFGQATISFKNAIFLDASIRNDWSSLLPPPYTFAYPSVGISAILSDLIDMPSFISYLKTTINYAEVGNGGRFGLLNTVYNYQPGAGNGYIVRSSSSPFPTLKPEIVKNLEAGFEIGLLNNRITANFNYYNSSSINQLLQVSVPVATGFSSRYINAGNIRNRGFEFIVKATPVSIKNFKWETRFNVAMNRNKIIELDANHPDNVFDLSSGVLRAAIVIAEVGGSFGDLMAYQWQKDNKGDHLVSADGKPMVTTDAEVIGNFNPKATLGWGNNFTIGNFIVGCLIDGRIGGIIVSGSEMNLAYSGITKATEKYREGGLDLGGVDVNGQKVTATITAQEFWQTVSGKRYGTGEFFAYDATNFRVRELSFGYNIPVNKSSVIKAARISAVARNLAWLYRGSSILDIPGLGKRKMSFDPDMSIANNNYQGVEYGTIPSTRSYGLNLNITF